MITGDMEPNAEGRVIFCNCSNVKWATSQTTAPVGAELRKDGY